MAALTEAQARRVESTFNITVDANFADAEVIHRLKGSKDVIVAICAANGIEFDNINQLKFQPRLELARKLLNLFPEPSPQAIGAWKQEFEDALRVAEQQSDLAKMHREADLSVGAQYQRTEKVLENTLLTIKDMTDLLPGPEEQTASEKVLVSPPNPEARDMPALIARANAETKELFVPLCHDGHMFYLLKNRENQWSLQDSQPKLASGYSPRQVTILAHGQSLLAEWGQRGPLSFATSGKQSKDYDCGTHVINAYRAKEFGLPPQSHRDTMIELAQTQAHLSLADAKAVIVPLTPDPTLESEQVAAVEHDALIDHTLPSDAQESDAVDRTQNDELIAKLTNKLEEIPDRFTIYKETIQKLIEKAQNPTVPLTHLPPEDIDNAEAKIKENGTLESDEEFAARLQEAELQNFRPK